ncbi:hypothetical protein CDD81_6199 [Ophiocordyceps australis]|uniref:Phosphoribosyltransferase domain-containing protein n=1 Tax=Ophiocordyceps australis TaxID=1399860 RepID=A0A2C5XHU2_9HYPO|nr:hypothetical protein CDD81_6199 [Ophiocordyceps australis]
MEHHDSLLALMPSSHSFDTPPPSLSHVHLGASSTSSTPSHSPIDPHGCPKPTVIGLYGLPGSGKTTLLQQLRCNLGTAAYCFHKGAEKISSLVPGGLAAFEQLSEGQKQSWRGRAMSDICREAAQTRRSALVTGHFMFWREGMLDCQPVHTGQDLAAYTHILYLGIDAQSLLQRRASDAAQGQQRRAASLEHLRQWQQTEVACLRNLCRQQGKLFAVVTDEVARTAAVVRYMVQGGAGANAARAEARLEQVLRSVGEREVETALVMEGDGTLAPHDTGAMFWQSLAPHELRDGTRCDEGVLRDLFAGPLGYSAAAFSQATLLCEEAVDAAEFEAQCRSVAGQTRLHDDFVSLLTALGPPQRHVAAIVVTSGLGRLWELVLEQAGLSGWVRVVGGGRVADGFSVCAAVKARLVARLQQRGVRVVAFGHSPLDLPMLEAADEAVVVVGHEEARSCTMEAALRQSLEARRLCGARQALMPRHAAPRLHLDKLPPLDIAHHGFVAAVLAHKQPPQSLQPVPSQSCQALQSVPPQSCKPAPPHDIVAAVDVVAAVDIVAAVQHATHRPAAQLLATPARDSSLCGAPLRRAHRRIGSYLALELLPRTLGLESFDIPLVHGHSTPGFRLAADLRTAILAILPAGEPMARGVADVMPRAPLIYARRPDELHERHLRRLDAVVLIDAVVNSGATVAAFVARLRALQPALRIVVLAGLVQQEAAALGGLVPWGDGCSLVALQVLERSFATDTANRLFNTTHFS